MKTQIARYLGSVALAAAMLTTSTAAFAATPNVNPALYTDDNNASQEGNFTANGLDNGGEALGLGAAVVETAAGFTEPGAVDELLTIVNTFEPRRQAS